jgi:hypothetical protein
MDKNGKPDDGGGRRVRVVKADVSWSAHQKTRVALSNACVGNRKVEAKKITVASIKGFLIASNFGLFGKYPILKVRLSGFASWPSNNNT